MDLPVLLYDNRFLDGTPTATDTEVGYDVLNIRDMRTFTWWKAASAGTKYIIIDCGTAKAVDALGIVGHNLFTAGATVSVESSSSGAWAGEEVERLAGFVPASDKAILKLFVSASARFWRVKIITATIAPQIAVLLLGERMTFERFLQGDFDPQPEGIESASVIGKTGNILGSVVRFHPIKVKPSWQNLTPAWIENTFRPAWDAHLKLLKPFIFAWDTGDHPDDVNFLKIKDGFTLNMPYTSNRRSLTLELEGIAE